MIVRKIIFLLVTIIILQSNAKPLAPFKEADQPSAPDYSDQKYWSALPFRKDAADLVPKAEKWIADSLKKVDVFYIYPTLYSKGKTWNADVNNKKLNKRLDNFPVKYQASIFNQVARVYAPRYRQAIIQSYSDTIGNGQSALDFAYEDVKKAFEYYLKNYNQGRPVIIASHSQGTTHCRRLLKDYFDTPDMKNKLVCAYVVGYEIDTLNYSVLKPCNEASETNCYVTWSTFKKGYEYKDNLRFFGNICVNPVSWKRDTLNVVSNGGILLNVNRNKKFRTEACISETHLEVNTNLTFMRNRGILHLVDFNLFWLDVRKNANIRVNEYLKKK